MEAKEVVDKILADANAEAQEIKDRGRGELNDQQAELGRQLDEYSKQTDSLAEKAAEDKKSHLLAAARMTIAKEFLSEKRAILDKVFDTAGSQLRNLPEQQYRKLMTKLLLGAVETGDEEVIVDNNESRIDQEFINQINEKLGPGNKGNLTLSEERGNFGAGFILKRGKIKNNVSLGVLLAQARKELEIKLSKKLFED